MGTLFKTQAETEFWKWKPLLAICAYQHTHTPRLMALFPGLPRWAGTSKVKPIWILLKQETEWQCHQLGHMQVCTSLQRDNHASTPLLSFLQAGCPSCRPTNSVRALKVIVLAKLRQFLRSLFLDSFLFVWCFHKYIVTLWDFSCLFRFWRRQRSCVILLWNRSSVALMQQSSMASTRFWLLFHYILAQI